MGDLVDAGLPRCAWMPVAYRQQEQRRPSGDGSTQKHCAPLAGRLRNVELDATWQAGSVSGLGIASLQPSSTSAARLELFDRGLYSDSSSVAQMRKVLHKLSLVYVDREGRSGGVFRHLPLAVDGEVAEMLVEFLRRHALSARTLKDRLNGGLFRWPLWRDYEPTISKRLLNHVGALYITGQLDVALRHGEIMAEVAVALSEPRLGSGTAPLPKRTSIVRDREESEPRETHCTIPTQSRKPRLLNVA